MNTNFSLNQDECHLSGYQWFQVRIRVNPCNPWSNFRIQELEPYSPQTQLTFSIFAASARSLAVTLLPAECVLSRITTRL